MAGVRLLHFLDTLLEYANLPPEQVKDIRLRINDNLTEGDGENLANFLLENQTDPIEAGRTYSQTDIKKKLSQWKQY